MADDPNQSNNISEDPIDWIEEFLLDDSEELHLELVLKAYAASSSSRFRRTIDRDREGGHERLERDYFAIDPVYFEETFGRRFRMRWHIFLRIVEALSTFDSYFQQRVDAIEKKGISPLQKCTAAIRMLAFGVSMDAVDDYVQMGESTAANQCLKKFVEDVILVFESEYLCKPNSNDIQRLPQMGDICGFPGMMGQHWQWKNCPKSWKGLYMNSYKGIPSIIFEAVVTSDCGYGIHFFGVSDSNNDIILLDQSSLFDEVLGHNLHYIVNGNNYDMGYHLTNDIYRE